jgi:hypothetical protein
MLAMCLRYRLDGHKRRYFQHVKSSSKTDWEVWLIREKDGFKIPFEEVRAVTLIALLRLNLLKETKDK